MCYSYIIIPKPPFTKPPLVNSRRKPPHASARNRKRACVTYQKDSARHKPQSCSRLDRVYTNQHISSQLDKHIATAGLAQVCVSKQLNRTYNKYEQTVT